MKKKSIFFQPVLIGTLAFSLCSCSSWFGQEEAPPLPGERLSIMQLQKKLEPDDPERISPFVAPEAWVNESWPFAGGHPNHAMQHLAFSSSRPDKIWSVDIGTGSTSESPITAQPVVADGIIFTLDTEGDVSAFSIEKGVRRWRVFAGEPDEDDTVIGGGLGYADGTVFVTAGYGEILALSGTDGAEIWRSKLPAPARLAPTVLDGRVYSVTMDNRLIALDSKTGTVLWTYRGVGEGTGLLGGAAPAATADIVLSAFSSGDLVAFRPQNGSVAWSDNLAPSLRLGGVSALTDIRALPVVDNGMVIALSYAGRLTAIDMRSGNRIWQRDIGGQETPVVAGPYLFVLGHDNQLIALARETGVIRWILPLDRFENPEKREGPLVWSGPLYAGGRLMVAGTGGRVLDIDPASGVVMGEWNMGGTPAVPLFVAGQTLYTLEQDGTLAAWK